MPFTNQPQFVMSEQAQPGCDVPVVAKLSHEMPSAARHPMPQPPMPFVEPAHPQPAVLPVAAVPAVARLSQEMPSVAGQPVTVPSQPLGQTPPPRRVQDLDGAGALLPTIPPHLAVANNLASSLTVQSAVSGHVIPAPKKSCSVLAKPAKPAKSTELPEQVAIVKIDAGATLTATVPEDSGKVEWEWARAVSFMGLKTNKHFVFLQRNSDKIKEELHQAEICSQEVNYRGKEAKAGMIGHHTMQSSALGMMLLLVAATRSFNHDSKVKALVLVSSLLRIASDAIETSIVLGCIVFGEDNQYHSGKLTIEEGCMVAGLAQLLCHNPAASSLWSKLMQQGVCGHKLRSAFQHPSLVDLIAFVLWTKMNMSHKKLWTNVGAFLWPKLLWVFGKVVDALALKKMNLPLEQVPLVTTAKGRARRPPWMNRIILLQKMRTMKHSRKQAMHTHQDLVTKGDALVLQEPVLACGIYMKKSMAAFQKAAHITVHWDPSSYDCSTLVAIAYSHQMKITGYLPIQNILPVAKEEVEMHIQQLAARNRITRIDGYCELRSLSHALKGIGFPLEYFQLPDDVHLKPLGQHETREISNGIIYIVNKVAKTKIPQIPPTFDINACPLLCSISDQGGINRASLDYCTFKLNLPLLCLYDPYHRGWNDLRDSMKRTRGGSLFKAMLSFSLLWNCNYGPAGSKEWFLKKQKILKDTMRTQTASSKQFLEFLPFICAERGLEEPTTPEGRSLVFQSLNQMNSTQVLGPIVKLMRWYSWFESEKWHRGENYATKYLMVSEKHGPVDGVNFVKSETVANIENQSKISEKQELQALKMRHGTWALAPLLVTPTSMFQKDLIATLAKASWTHHSQRAKHVLSPEQVCSFTISLAEGNWQNEVYDLIVDGFLNPTALLKLYPPNSIDPVLKQSRLQMHVDFVCKLVGKRAGSLFSFYKAPPVRYASLLLPEKSAATQKLMLSDWRHILKLEHARACGHVVEGLQSCQFLSSSYTRLAYVLNEIDFLQGSAQAHVLMRHALEHLGDSACIESTHSSAKDMLREARHTFRSRTHKFHACISSKVLESRQTPHNTISEAELAMGKSKRPPQHQGCHPSK